MDGVQNPHDDYVNQQWVDLGNMQHGQHHPLSPHQQGFHYGFVESPGFASPDSPYRLQSPSIPPPPNYLGLQQWVQTMPSQPSPAANHHYSIPHGIATGPSQLGAAAAITSPVGHPTLSASNPRRTLTDNDRRRMCMFHEENPNVKQTEIGAMFGVERSTVSKVLRQKEKYLFPDDGSRSPIKRSKGKFPDIERALSVWAKNTRKSGITLTDVMIREKARFFALSLGISDNHFKANSASWLEKFKHKNNMHPNGRGRSESDVTGVARGSVSNFKRPGHTRTESTPNANGTREDCHMMKQTNSQESHTGTESPDSFMGFTGGFKAFQRQQSSGSVSTAPLSSSFTDKESLGPASPTSPFYSSESRIGSAHPSPGFPSQARIPPGAQQRPRSQTFPLAPIDTNAFTSSPASSEPMTRQTSRQPDAHSMSVNSEGLTSPNMTPPSSAQSVLAKLELISNASPSKDDAKKALEVFIAFLRQQPVGFVEPDDYVIVAKLLEKFGLDSSVLTNPTPT